MWSSRHRRNSSRCTPGAIDKFVTVDANIPEVGVIDEPRTSRVCAAQWCDRPIIAKLDLRHVASILVDVMHDRVRRVRPPLSIELSGSSPVPHTVRTADVRPILLGKLRIRLITPKARHRRWRQVEWRCDD